MHQFSVANDTLTYTLLKEWGHVLSRLPLSDQISMRPQCILGAFTSVLRAGDIAADEWYIPQSY